MRRDKYCMESQLYQKYCSLLLVLVSIIALRHSNNGFDIYIYIVTVPMSTIDHEKCYFAGIGTICIIHTLMVKHVHACDLFCISFQFSF